MLTSHHLRRHRRPSFVVVRLPVDCLGQLQTSLFLCSLREHAAAASLGVPVLSPSLVNVVNHNFSTHYLYRMDLNPFASRRVARSEHECSSSKVDLVVRLSSRVLPALCGSVRACKPARLKVASTIVSFLSYFHIWVLNGCRVVTRRCGVCFGAAANAHRFLCPVVVQKWILGLLCFCCCNGHICHWVHTG